MLLAVTEHRQMVRSQTIIKFRRIYDSSPHLPHKCPASLTITPPSLGTVPRSSQKRCRWAVLEPQVLLPRVSVIHADSPSSSPEQPARCLQVRARLSPQPWLLVTRSSGISELIPLRTKTCCFPGATVRDVTEKAIEILANELAISISISVSGPIPTCACSSGHFSRLLTLHSWLSSACASHGVSYIDNFNLFWERRQLFKFDGIHQNRLGANSLMSTPSDQSHYYWQ